MQKLGSLLQKRGQAAGGRGAPTARSPPLRAGASTARAQTPLTSPRPLPIGQSSSRYSNYISHVHFKNIQNLSKIYQKHHGQFRSLLFYLYLFTKDDHREVWAERGDSLDASLKEDGSLRYTSSSLTSVNYINSPLRLYITLPYCPMSPTRIPTNCHPPHSQAPVSPGMHNKTFQQPSQYCNAISLVL